MIQSVVNRTAMLLALTLCAFCPGAAAMSALRPAVAEIEPRAVAWGDVDRRIFPGTWILPEELWRPRDPAKDLPAIVRGLLRENFAAPADAPWMASVGDIIVEHRRRGGTRSGLNELLSELAAARPEPHARLAPLLAEVLVSDESRSPKWKPSMDDADDGVYFGPLLERNRSGASPWSDQKGSRDFHQAATFIRADLPAILDALHDYPATFRDPGTSYEKLDPRADSLMVGTDDEMGPFAALRLSIRSDLPFPFSHYDCDLGILHRLDGEKHLVTYVFSPSNDFYWLAGRDVHYPVLTVAGEWVGTMMVRISGFDLRGVPDGNDDRKLGSLTALGNLRRRAEQGFAAAGGTARIVDGALPALRVLTR